MGVSQGKLTAGHFCCTRWAVTRLDSIRARGVAVSRVANATGCPAASAGAGGAGASRQHLVISHTHARLRREGGRAGSDVLARSGRPVFLSLPDGRIPGVVSRIALTSASFVDRLTTNTHGGQAQTPSSGWLEWVAVCLFGGRGSCGPIKTSKSRGETLPAALGGVFSSSGDRFLAVSGLVSSFSLVLEARPAGKS